ncbi:hypothetical protein F5882DRAFT_525877 [Hyaloscypha sp. PMI_1271]|nr:hypothetical protein F5882DRAFT_525877 [Hyaloscypha sp. PMI_1271]
MTPLCLATKSGNFDIVQLLLERRANPNGARGAEHSPLVCACSRGHNKIVQLLLDRLADIELKDADGDPALHSAACFGHLSTVELLLKSDADVNARGAGHRTALWYATEGGHEAVVGLLLKHGADGDPKSDMKDDSHIPLGKGADGDVFRHIERGQQLMFHESDFTWSEKLFFVVNSDTNGSSGSDLTLIQPDTESKEPYIAVSYCWSGHQDSSTATPRRIHIPQKDEPGCPPHTRDVRANSSVIRRCMEFAAAKGVKRIWIDQESIDQENKAVKQQAIQSMHLVYRRAAHTLVLLDCHVQSPDDIQALSEILRHGVHDDFRDRILGDRWFTRAWTFQEWINSQLENLSYLVGWKDDVDVDGIAWRRVADARNRDGKVQKVSRAWEFGHDEIFSMSFRSMRHTEVMRSLSASATFGGIGSEKRSFTLLDTSAEEMEGKTDVPLCQSKSYQKLRMTMPAAYGTLSGKRNLLVSDRLAILSNLTHYRYRIHTHEVIQNALSFTASVIATALYNGDLTILFCRPDPVRADGDEVPEKQRNPSWAPLGEYGLSYLKLPYALSGHSRLSDRIRSGDPCLVLDGKALVRGILWDIVPFHGFDQLADAVGCFLREYTKPYRTKEGKIDEAGHVVFQLLVEQLLSQDRTDIVELLLISALPRQLASPAEAFKLIGELKEWRRTRAEEDWPNHILEKSSLETDHLGVARFAGTAGGLAMIMTERSLFPPYGKVEFLGGHPWGNQIIQWIYRAISKGMPLALGQCEIGGETLVSLFMLDPAKHSVVFTPLSELEYEYGANVAIHMHPKENFWVVKGSGGKVGDGLIQRAKDKLRTFEMHEENISSDIFEIQNAGHVCGVWSPRLSRAGIWTKSDGKTWEMRPLGKAPSYIWFD